MHENHHPIGMPRPARFDAAIFNLKTVSLSRCRGKKPSTLLESARHNLREIHPVHGAINDIDPRRSEDNVILHGPSTAAEVIEIAKQLLAQVAGLRLKRDHVQAIELVFSVPIDFTDQREYFEQCIAWTAKTLGLPILSAVIHLDQSHPHMHVLLLPVKEGRHVGGEPINRRNFYRLRNGFFEKVSGPAGLQRSNPKMHGAIKILASEAIITEAVDRGLPEHNGEFWPTLEKAIRDNPLPLVMELGIDVEALRRRMLAPLR